MKKTKSFGFGNLERGNAKIEKVRGRKRVFRLFN
jgi:hypothetical protein